VPAAGGALQRAARGGIGTWATRRKGGPGHSSSRFDGSWTAGSKRHWTTLAAGARDRAKAILREVIEDESIDEAEAALMLGVSRRTMQNWRQDGTGPRFFKISAGERGGVRYSRLEIREFREERTTTSTAAVLASAWRHGRSRD
jgi:predicted DNA-binding transcriptional regulator AlpA